MVAASFFTDHSVDGCVSRSQRHQVIAGGSEHSCVTRGVPEIGAVIAVGIFRSFGVSRVRLIGLDLMPYEIPGFEESPYGHGGTNPPGSAAQ